MKRRTVLLAVIILFLFAGTATASPARVGSVFADTYSAFSPLYALYKAYANFLFSGFEVVVPEGLEQACSHLQESLETLQMELITQTDSQRVEQVTRLAHLRQGMSIFCQTYSLTIEMIVHPPAGDTDPLQIAADRGLFAAISDKNKALEGLFASTLDSYSDHAKWVFAVSFSMRTILNQHDLSRLDSSLREILLGPDDAPYPPGIVPSDLLLEVQRLAGLVGGKLDRDQADLAIALARRIYDYLMR